MKAALTETRFSSTNGVSMWCLIVAIMSLKSRAEMTPFFPLSFWANAWRACSSCNSWDTQHDTRSKISGWRTTHQSDGAACDSSVPEGTEWTPDSWDASYCSGQSAGGWTRSPSWTGCGGALWSGWRCPARSLQHKREKKCGKGEKKKEVKKQKNMWHHEWIMWQKKKGRREKEEIMQDCACVNT